MGGVAVGALAPHHCDPGSTLALGVTRELSLLLVLSFASRVFLRVLRLSSLNENPSGFSGRRATLWNHCKFLFIYLLFIYLRFLT
jgi:hypothetical protein